MAASVTPVGVLDKLHSEGIEKVLSNSPFTGAFRTSGRFWCSFLQTDCSDAITLRLAVVQSLGMGWFNAYSQFCLHFHESFFHRTAAETGKLK